MAKDTSEKKRLLAASAAYIMGLKPMLKIRGNRERVDAYRDMVVESRKLYQVLSQGADIEDAAEQLAKKKAAVRKFQRITGIKWPL